MTAEGFRQKDRNRTRRYTFLGLIIGLVIAGIAVAVPNIVMPIVIIILIAAGFFLWHYPQITLYILFLSVCLFEQYPCGYSDSITDQVPFFWNVNTIVQRFAHADFKGIPLNLVEVVLLTAGSFSFARAVYMHKMKLIKGSLFWPICAYMCFVMMGWIIGMLSGGDFKVSLMEVRPEFYFMVSYLMAVNLVKERKQVEKLMWAMAICMAIKGIMYTFRRYITLGGAPLPDQGVGSHEEAFLFDNFELMVIILTVFKVYPRLRTFMWIMLPMVIMGNLATNRRAGTAAIAIAIPLLFLAADRALPTARTRIRLIAVGLVVAFFCYYQVFKDSSSAFAQPALAIGSIISPNPRDAASNAYRDAENVDILETVKSAPIQGFGYGKHFLHVAPIVDISSVYEYWDIMPHNSVLWVWMRTGTIGYISFWMMVAAIIITASQVLKDDKSTPHVKAVATYCLIVICILIVFGLLDLQLAMFRDMLYAGFWTGVLAGIKDGSHDRQPLVEAAT